MTVTELFTLDEYNSALSGNPKVAIDYFATWCGPCKVIGPKFYVLSADFPDIKFFRVDVDKNGEASQKAGISAMPTFKFFHNGAEFDELVGASEEKLKTLLDKLNSL